MKTRKILLSLLILFVINQKLKGQVNLQTGSPQISYPLFTISDVNSRISAGVTLNYTGGNGIKVDDVGTSVGTGWSLNTGVSVTRVQNGLPDDQKKGTKEICEYPLHWLDGYLYSQSNAPLITDPSIPVTNGAIWSPKQMDYSGKVGIIPTKKALLSASDQRYQVDREIDKFILSINNTNIVFFIGKGITKKVFFENDEFNNYKIDIIWDESLSTPSILTTIRGFVITDPVGIQYQLMDMELNELISYDLINYYNKADGKYIRTKSTIFCPYLNNLSNFNWQNITDPYTSNDIPANQFKCQSGIRTGMYIGSNWLITKIYNPLTNKSINYYYDDVSIYRRGSIEVTYTSGFNNLADSYSFFENTVSYKMKKIKEMNNDNNDRIEFNYQVDLRKDLSGDKILKEIRFYLNNKFIQQINLKIGYFLKNRIVDINYNFSEQDLVFLRICLQSISSTVGKDVTEKIADFEYVLHRINDPDILNDYDIVPPVFSIYKDHWGYYNGFSGVLANGDGTISTWNRYPYTISDNYRKQTLCALVKGDYNGASPNADRPKNSVYQDLISSLGLIKTVTNNLGGSTTYEYEPNSVSDIKKINGKLQYTDKIVGGVRVKNVIYFEGNNVLQQKKYEYPVDSKGHNSGWGGCWGQFNDAIYSITKDYSISNNDGCSPYGSNHIAIPAQNAVQSQIVKIINTKFTMDGVQAYFLATLLEIIIKFFGGGAQPNFDNYQLTTYYSEAINQNNFIPLSYKKVKVTDIKNNIIGGSTVYEFTSWDDFFVDLEYDPTNAPSQKMLSFKFNLPKSVSTYDDKQKLLTLKIFDYSETQSDVTPASNQLISQSWVSKKIVSQNSVFWNYAVIGSNGINVFVPQPFGTCSGCINDYNYLSFPPTYFPYEDGKSDQIYFKIYNPIKGRIELNGLTEITIGSISKSIKKSSVIYNSKNLIAKKSSLNSKNELIETEYKYACDYNNIPAIDKLNLNNYYTAPVLTETYITKKTDRYLLSGTITDYDIIGNGDVKPTKVYKFRSDKPIDETILQPFNPSQIVRDPAYYELVTIMNYDNDGNLVETLDETNNNAVVINPKFQGQIIASVANAKKADIAFTSFESPSDISNLVFDGSNLVNTIKLTGAYGYHYNATQISKISKDNLTTNKKYKVSFWFKNGTSPSIYLDDFNTLNSSSILITPVSIFKNLSNGWELYEAEVLVNSTGVINIVNQSQGSITESYIDEVRIYPIESQMQSMVYNFKGQKIAECDATNRFKFYEYNEKDQLKFIRNEEGSILKMYEYKTNQK